MGSKRLCDPSVRPENYAVADGDRARRRRFGSPVKYALNQRALGRNPAWKSEGVEMSATDGKKGRVLRASGT